MCKLPAERFQSARSGRRDQQLAGWRTHAGQRFRISAGATRGFRENCRGDSSCKMADISCSRTGPCGPAIAGVWGMERQNPVRFAAACPPPRSSPANGPPRPTIWFPILGRGNEQGFDQLARRKPQAQRVDSGKVKTGQTAGRPPEIPAPRPKRIRSATCSLAASADYTPRSRSDSPRTDRGRERTEPPRSGPPRIRAAGKEKAAAKDKLVRDKAMARTRCQGTEVEKTRGDSTKDRARAKRAGIEARTAPKVETETNRPIPAAAATARRVPPMACGRW